MSPAHFYFVPFPGEYSEDRRQGEGVMVWARSGRSYAGMYDQGRRHGKGEMTFPNGDKYTGDWEQVC